MNKNITYYFFPLLSGILALGFGYLIHSASCLQADLSQAIQTTESSNLTFSKEVKWINSLNKLNDFLHLSHQLNAHISTKKQDEFIILTVHFESKSNFEVYLYFTKSNGVYQLEEIENWQQYQDMKDCILSKKR